MPSPLIRRLIEQQGFARLNAANLEQVLAAEGTLVLFLTEDPTRYPESNDVAVILPELLDAFPERFQPMVVDRELEPQLKTRYDITIWPCLVFLRNGRFLGKIAKVRDWADYLKRIATILERPGGPNPGLGIPLIDASRASEDEHAHG